MELLILLEQLPGLPGGPVRGGLQFPHPGSGLFNGRLQLRLLTRGVAGAFPQGLQCLFALLHLLGIVRPLLSGLLGGGIQGGHRLIAGLDLGLQGLLLLGVLLNSLPAVFKGLLQLLDLLRLSRLQLIELLILGGERGQAVGVVAKFAYSGRQSGLQQ